VPAFISGGVDIKRVCCCGRALLGCGCACSAYDELTSMRSLLAGMSGVSGVWAIRYWAA